MISRTLTFALILSLTPAFAEAARDSDIMPPPAKSPRIPVESEALKTQKEFEGPARALDGERIIIGSREIRLYGIVTPGLSSNYGPQARLKLDKLLAGTILCKVTDRDAEGRPVAFCGTTDVPDISYEMLRQGWAMADRKALKGSRIAEIYGQAEAEAQNQNKGLFAPQPLAMAIPITNPAKAVAVPDPTPAATTLEPSKAGKPPQQNAAPASESNAAGPGLIERYQLLLGSLIWLLGSGVFVAGILWRGAQKIVSRRREVAAALHGELMAARHICRTRARELKRRRRLANEAEKETRPASLWPRIRSYVYQAHVGSIGLLGAELARRVASVYGQCADYAVYYQPSAQSRMASPYAVSETLFTLADHIDIVLEGLAQIEATGRPFRHEAETAVLPQGAEEEAEPQQPADSYSGRVEHLTHAVPRMFRKNPQEGAVEPEENLQEEKAA